jgi:16S rRNA G966 N2-methylase RsmD
MKKKGKSYDFVFIGAPYPFTRIPEILKIIYDFGIVNRNGKLILEHVKGLFLEYDFRTLTYIKIYSYGQTILELFESKL